MGGVEHRPFGVVAFEADAVGEGEHGVGADDDAEGVGDAVHVVVAEPPRSGSTTTAMKSLRRPWRIGTRCSTGMSTWLNVCSRAPFATRRRAPGCRPSRTGRADPRFEPGHQIVGAGDDAVVRLNQAGANSSMARRPRTTAHGGGEVAVDDDDEIRARLAASGMRAAALRRTS